MDIPSSSSPLLVRFLAGTLRRATRAGREINESEAGILLRRDSQGSFSLSSSLACMVGRVLEAVVAEDLVRECWAGVANLDEAGAMSKTG